MIDRVRIVLLHVAIVACVVGLSACARVDNRVTQELIYPASETHPAEVVVRWPVGIAPGDVFTGASADGRTISTAPLPDPGE